MSTDSTDGKRRTPKAIAATDRRPAVRYGADSPHEAAWASRTNFARTIPMDQRPSPRALSSCTRASKSSFSFSPISVNTAPFLSRLGLGLVDLEGELLGGMRPTYGGVLPLSIKGTPWISMD